MDDMATLKEMRKGNEDATNNSAGLLVFLFHHHQRYPSFLLEFADFIEYESKFIAITTEGQQAKNTSNTSKIGQATYSNKNNDGDNNDKYQIRRDMEIYSGQ